MRANQIKNIRILLNIYDTRGRHTRNILYYFVISTTPGIGQKRS